MSQMEDDFERLRSIFEILQSADSTVNKDKTVTVIFDEYLWNYIKTSIDNSYE